MLGGLLAGTAGAVVVDDNIAGVSGAYGGARLFARGDAGTLVGRRWAGSAWTAWSDFGGMQMTSGPSADVRRDGTVDVFAKGPDDAIYHRYLSAGRWTDWGSIGGIAASAPASTARYGTETLDVVVRGGDNRFYHKLWNPTAGWSDWGSLDGQFLYAPTVISHQTGKLDVFGVGVDHQLYQKHWDGSAWSAWMPLGGYLTSAPSAVSQQSGRVDVFARDGNNNVAQLSWNGSAWSQWGIIATIATSGPGAYSEGLGRVDLFVRGGAQLYQNQFASGAWSGWLATGATAGALGIPTEPVADYEITAVGLSSEETAFDVGDDAEARAAAASGSCRARIFTRWGSNLVGTRLIWLRQEIRWCTQVGRLTYVKRFISSDSPGLGWEKDGGTTSQTEGGVGRTTFRSNLQQKFRLCGNIGPVGGCIRTRTIVNDVEVGPNAAWAWRN